MHLPPKARSWIVIGLAAGPFLVSRWAPLTAYGRTRDEVERAIRDGVRYLKQEQRGDGMWADVHGDARTGTTSLVTLALLTAGEKPDSPTVRKAIDYLRTFGPDQLNSTYAIALQTMVYAAAEPEPRHAPDRRQRELARIGPDQAGRPRPLARFLDLLQLQAHPARRQLQFPVRPARPGRGQRGWSAGQARGLGHGAAYWEHCQKGDGSWAYTPDSAASTASMTCAGISSLVITGLKRFQGRESLHGELINNCGKGAASISLQRGIDWLANHFQVGENYGNGQQWKLYYLYGLERAGRLGGLRFSARTTGIAWGPKSWFTTRTSFRASGKAPDRGRQDGRNQLRAFVPGQGPRRSWSTSWPRAPGRLEQRPRRRPQPCRRRLPRPGETSSPGRSSIPPSPPSPISNGARSSSSLVTGSPSSMPWPSRTSATTSSRAGSSSPMPAAPAPNSIPASNARRRRPSPIKASSFGPFPMTTPSGGPNTS